MWLLFNDLLNIKLIQYTLVLWIICLTCLSVWLEIKVSKLEIEKAYFEVAYTKVSAGLAVQNEKIEELAKKTEQQKKNLEQAVTKASVFALERDKAVKAIAEYSFTGECSQMLTQALEIINTNIKEK